MVETQKRKPFYLITGLVIGLILGVFYGWVVNPTRYIDISPSSLHKDQKKQYLLLIAQSYQANEDIGRSYARVKQMMDPVNVDELRAMLLEMETDVDFADQFEGVRNFINDLDTYIQTMQTVAQTPIAPPTMPTTGAPAQPQQLQPPAETVVSSTVVSTDPAADFFVIQN